MTEVTRVPIQPVAKGSLIKLWAGVALAILLGGALAWLAMPKTLSLETLTAGEGEFPKQGDIAFVKYTGTLADTGEEFDKWRPEPLPIPGIFPEGQVFPVEEGATIEGFYEGLQMMQKGGKYKLFIPADKAYGAEPPPGSPIPANADLVFEMELIDFFNPEQVEQKIAIMQKAIEEQGGLPGAPGGPEGGPPAAGQQGGPPAAGPEGGAPVGPPPGAPSQPAPAPPSGQ
ncbi:MAG: FKBP-type peptidyl-prolyl cis-trans isomerase [Pseudomonadota bacterium]